MAVDSSPGGTEARSPHGRRPARAALLAAVLVAAGRTAAALTLAGPGGETLPVVLVRDAVPAERTAARELARYLGRASGAEFHVVGEDRIDPGAPAIHVGATRAAIEAGLAPVEAPEAWRVRTDRRRLFLVGGRPRGTLYAVYRFLEDRVGVRWWTPWDEFVPTRRRLSVRRLDDAGRPAFAYRDVHGVEGPREFLARHRVNGRWAGVPDSHGGRWRFGSPLPVHSFYAWAPPERWCEEHPEWYSEIDGQRTCRRAQLCLTDAALAAMVADAVVAGARAERHRAAGAGDDPARLFDLSQNDWGRPCGCEACSGLAARHGSQAGPLIAFVNSVASRVAERLQEQDAAAVDAGVRLTTLAYHYTLDPPAGIAPREDVIVRLAALHDRDFSASLLDPPNARYRRAVEGWSAIAPHLWIWDYSVTFARTGDLPRPNLRALARDWRFHLDHGVEGLFFQHDGTIASDLRDLKLWVLLHLMEQPSRPVDALVREFTDGYYGRAGVTIRHYLRALRWSAARRPSRIGFNAVGADYAWLDLRFLRLAHRLFDRAERRVADQPELVQRVRHARLSLDRATLLRWAELTAEWTARGVGPAGRGLDREAIARRYVETWYREIDRRIPAARRPRLRHEVDAERRRLLLIGTVGVRGRGGGPGPGTPPPPLAAAERGNQR